MENLQGEREGALERFVAANDEAGRLHDFLRDLLGTGTPPSD